MATAEIRDIIDSFSRPADTTLYSVGDLVANSTTAGSVTPLEFHLGPHGGHIVRLKLNKSGVTITNATFTVHLYSASPTPANGDNSAWSTDLADYLGSVTLPAMVAGTDVGHTLQTLGESSGVYYAGGIHVAQKIIYALIEVEAGYTPESGETFTLTLTVDKESF